MAPKSKKGAGPPPVGNPAQPGQGVGPATTASAPGGTRAGGRRRAAAAEPAASPQKQPGGGGEPHSEQPSKRRRTERLQGDGGTTSAAAAAAGAAAAGEEAEGQQGDGLVSPMSPGSLGAAPTNRRQGDHLMEAVVKVFTVHSEPNFSLPWQRKRQFSSSGSGFVISGRRLLTNAHVVDHHTQVKVKRRGSDTKYVAQVLAIGVECDIALVTVEDESFWEGLEAVNFGSLPHLQESVTVIGYPIGGDTMSVTSGVVSRIEVTGYAHGAAELLGIQVDAAINSGNSGGPAFNDRGECVGIAFQSLKNEDTENISYIIPTPVIQHFINDYERHGKYTGFPSLGIEWQKMESPVLRQALGMQPGQRGVLVRRVEPTSPLSSIIKQGDVVLSFDGVDIGSDGTVPFRSGERISFTYLISSHYTGDEVVLRVLHAKAVQEVTVQLRSPRRLIPVHINNQPPSYYIVGGLVFTPVTVPLLRSEYGKEYEYDAPVKLLHSMMHQQANNPTEQIVVVNQVLAADANVGYEEIVNTQVLKVNGQAVNNLRDLVAAVDGSTGQYLTLDLDYNQLVILDKEAAQAATADILTQHCIAHDRSEDLRSGAAAAAAAAAKEEDNPAADMEVGAAEGGLPGSGATPLQAGVQVEGSA